MNAAQKARIKRWVAALRSGKYEQGQGYLRQDITDHHGHTTSEFCCLGVLCDLTPRARLVRYNDRPSDEAIRHYDFGRTTNDQVIDHVAWTELTGLPDTFQSELTDMNDSGSYGFDEIADCIEARAAVVAFL